MDAAVVLVPASRAEVGPLQLCHDPHSSNYLTNHTIFTLCRRFLASCCWCIQCSVSCVLMAVSCAVCRVNVSAVSADVLCYKEQSPPSFGGIIINVIEFSPSSYAVLLAIHDLCHHATHCNAWCSFCDSSMRKTGTDRDSRGHGNECVEKMKWPGLCNVLIFCNWLDTTSLIIINCSN